MIPECALVARSTTVSFCFQAFERRNIPPSTAVCADPQATAVSVQSARLDTTLGSSSLKQAEPWPSLPKSPLPQQASSLRTACLTMRATPHAHTQSCQQHCCSNQKKLYAKYLTEPSLYINVLGCLALSVWSQGYLASSLPRVVLVHMAAAT